MHDFDDKTLAAMLERCKRETGGEVFGWKLIFHINGPGGKSSGAVTLSVYYSTPESCWLYWNHTIRKADHSEKEQKSV